ncbi:unnamed protein product [Adineta ricciae]|uniref:Uncharacterized protein n=1 Tax=Adineta ricciae TaxID=249248 RepID=A0A815IZB3_ADIRI|nr:unnamed protein product [Adineta ricciae]CAF1372275.1 unnamed protein product [Adineta ricciae]
MSSPSSQTVSPPPSSSSLYRSNELVNLTTASQFTSNSTSFAPLHRTVEVENLHDHIDDNNEQQPPTASKKVLTKCMTVIGDGSDKQIS